MPAEKQPLPAFIGKRIAFYDSMAQVSRGISQLIPLRSGMPRKDAEILLQSDKEVFNSERLAEQIRSEFGVEPLHVVARLSLGISNDA